VLRVVAAVLFGALLGLLVGTAPARADPAGCDQAIADAAGLLAPGQDLDALRRDTARLARDGAVVRVRTYGRLPSGGMDAAERAAEHSCPSWTEHGHRLDHLVVFAVSKGDRRTGLYYGSSYRGRLGSRWNGIETDDMNGEFAGGHYAAGLDRGVTAVDRLLTEAPPRAASGGLAWWSKAVLVVVLVGPLAVLFWLWRRTRRAGSGDRDDPDTVRAAAGADARRVSGGSGYSGGGGGGDGGGGGSTGW
jgi:uncharacterized membrane protein YgcG